ncbi:MAG: YCF48-related protein [bacterium]
MVRKISIILIGWFICNCPLSAQKITKQFQQTRYDLKDICLINSNTGWTVGGKHWDQSTKQYQATILKTINGGSEWTVQSAAVNEDLWDVHFIDSNKGWAVGNSGTIVHTVNGGDTWTVQNAGINLNFKSVYFTDGLNGWAVANEPIHYDPFDEPDGWQGRVFHTSNGGEDWTEQTFPGDAGILHCIYFQNNQKGWAAGIRNDEVDFLMETSGAMYYTEDGGVNWVEKYVPGINVVFTDINFVTEERGWAVGFAGSSGETGGTIFKTTDGGDTWQRIAENYTLWDVEFIDSLRGYAVGTAYNSAWGPPVIRTMDGGDSWGTIRMEEHDGYTGLYALTVFEDKVVAVGDKGYIATSADPWGDLGMFGQGEDLFTQKSINELYEFEDVYFINEIKGWTTGRKSIGPDTWAQAIFHTSDGGETWTEQYSLATEWMSNCTRLDAVQFVTENKGWAVGHSSDVGTGKTTGILYTEDGGETWSQQAQGVSEGQIVDLFFLDDQKGWALTDAISYPDMSIQLFKTTNGGTSWELINTSQPGTITIGYEIKSGKIFFQDENTGWVLGAQCDLIKTVDGGKTWSAVSLPEEYYNTYSIIFSDEDNGIICGETTFKTSDGGDNWIKQDIFAHNMTDVCFSDSSQGWMVGEWGDIYKSSNGGDSWEQIENTATSAAMKSVSFPGKNKGWATGRGGTIIKIDDTGGTTIDQKNTIPVNFQLSQNYPNPFNLETTIVYSLDKAGHVKLTVYNIRGERIVTLINDFRHQGSYQVNWDGRDMKGKVVSSGIYIYKLSFAGNSICRKMFLLK